MSKLAEVGEVVRQRAALARLCEVNGWDLEDLEMEAILFGGSEHWIPPAPSRAEARNSAFSELFGQSPEDSMASCLEIIETKASYRKVGPSRRWVFNYDQDRVKHTRFTRVVMLTVKGIDYQLSRLVGFAWFFRRDICPIALWRALLPLEEMRREIGLMSAHQRKALKKAGGLVVALGADPICGDLWDINRFFDSFRGGKRDLHFDLLGSALCDLLDPSEMDAWDGWHFWLRQHVSEGKKITFHE